MIASMETNIKHNKKNLILLKNNNLIQQLFQTYSIIFAESILSFERSLNRTDLNNKIEMK